MKLCCQILFSVSVKCFQVPNMNNHIPEIGFNLLLPPPSYLCYFISIFIFIFYILFASSAEILAFTYVQLYKCNYTYMYSSASDRTWLCGCNQVYTHMCASPCVCYFIPSNWQPRSLSKVTWGPACLNLCSREEGTTMT